MNMTENTFDESFFKDYYKADNSDDEENNNELLARLYGEIYYPSNNEIELEPNISSNAIPLSNYCINELIKDQENVPYNLNNKVISELGVTKEQVAEEPTQINKINLADQKTKNITEQVAEEFTQINNINLAHQKTKDITEQVAEEFTQINNINLAHQKTKDITEQVAEEFTQINNINLAHQKTKDITEQVAEEFTQINNINLAHQKTKDITEQVAEEFTQINNINLAHQKTKNITEIQKNKGSSSKKYKSSKFFCGFITKPKNNQQRKLQKRNITLVDKSDMDTKYNVLNKKTKQEIQLSRVQGEILIDSDSESILEVPIPPKPKPLVIDLQDTDDEDAGSSIDEDDLLKGKLYSKNASKSDLNLKESSPEVEIIETSFDHQDIATTSSSVYKSSQNKNTSTMKTDKSTRAPVIQEDIVLNCTMIQKGARSINEIKQSSRSTEQNRIETSVKDTNLKKRLESASRNLDNACTSLRSCWESKGIGVQTRSQMRKMQSNVSKTDSKTDNTRTVLLQDLKHAVQTLEDTLLEVSCNVNDNLVMSQKRHNEDSSKDNEVRGKGGRCGESREATNSPARKRQCTVQQSDQLNVASTTRSSYENMMRDTSSWSDNFFRPLPEDPRKFYSDSCGQENFDIRDIQSFMSRDPRKWRILDADLMPSPAISKSRCSFCRQDNHLHRNCPELSKTPCCQMCGQSHRTWGCPQRMCLTCGKKQTYFSDICEHCRTLYCAMCCSVGHKKEYCPDLWRRYHSTTKDIGCAPRNPGYVMKSPNQLHCCNCSKRGHEYSMCKEHRWSSHFPTPACVTSYTEGPVYDLQINPDRLSTDNRTRYVPSFKTSNELSNQQMHKRNTPVTKAQAVSLPNVDATFSLDIDINEVTWPQSTPKSTQSTPQNRPQSTQSTPQRTQSTPQSMLEQATQISETTVLKFDNVMYCCGNYVYKNDRNARSFVSNLSQHKDLCLEAKKFLQSKFSNNTVFPVFLRKLRKVVEFQLTIGLLVNQTDVMVQLIAPKYPIYQLFNFLLHWLNLPLIEKPYGIHVKLPMQAGQMYNFLMGLNMHKLSENIKEPLKLFHVLLGMRNKLRADVPKNKEYFNNQTCMWGIQMKLLAFINTHPQPSIHFHKIQSYIEILKFRTSNEQLDAVTYLDILFHYNKIYTPHTPPNLGNTLKFIIKPAQKFTQRRGFSSDANVNFSMSSATSCSYTSQKTDTVNLSTSMQNMSHNVSNVEEGNIDIYQPGGSNQMENYMQYPEDFLSLDVDPIQLQNSQKEDSQWSIDNIYVNTNSPVTGISMNVIHARNKKKKIKKKLSAEDKLKAKLGQQRRQQKANMFRQHVEKTMDEARTFQAPYIVQAVEDLERKWKNKTLNKKDLQKVKKMMKIETKQQEILQNVPTISN